MSFEHPRWLLHVPSGDTDQPPYALRWIALVVISLAIMLIGIDITVVGVAVPALTRDLHATNSDIQWVFDGFTVALGGFVLLGGGLADRFGRKGVFQIGMVIFALGSLVAAFATTPGVLIVGRVITGFGAALVMPPALSMIGVIFPPNERPKAIGIWAAVAALGMALGPVIGGVLLQDYFFGSVFLINVPVTIIAIVGAALVVPTSRRPGDVPLDLFGSVLSVLGLGGLVAAVIEAPARGLTNPLVIVCLVVGVLATGLFIWWQLRAEQPLFDVRVFRIARVVVGALSVMVIYITFNGTEQLLVPQYLQYVEGYSTLETGLLLIPVGVVFGFVSMLSPRAVRRAGERRVMELGLVAMGVGMAIFGAIVVWGGYANILVGILVFFVGVGLVMTPATSQIMNALPTEKAGDGSAVNQISRQVGGALGVAISGSIYAAVYSSRFAADAGSSLTPEQLQVADGSIGGALGVASTMPSSQSAAIVASATDATVTAMSWAFAISAVLVVVVLAVVAVLLRRTPAGPDRPSADIELDGGV